MADGGAGPEHVVELDPASRPSSDQGEFTFIGTATVLLRCDGFTVLTDPNFLHQGQHAKLGYGLRSRRLTEPAAQVADLPPIDLVVLSHHHGDHFDEVAAADLPKDVPIVTTGHAARKLGRQGFRRALPLETWESAELRCGDRVLEVTAMPGRHAPQPLQALFPPVMGSVLDFRRGDQRRFRTYITGDTLLIDDLREVPQRFPGVDLMVLHLGGTRVLGVLVTMDAEQGVRALELVRPRHAIPVHFDDYTVFKSPLSDFRDALARSAPVAEVHVLDRGETYRFALAGRHPGSPPRPEESVMPDDETVVEPENSTVDDWFGQNVARDQEVADRVAEESDTMEEAEQKFEEQAEGQEKYEEGHPRPD